MIDKILIHTCCADCLLNALSFLEEKEYINQNSEILSLFYNPNIHPRAEYLERLNAVKKILPDLKKRWSINIIIPSYSPKEYMSKVLLSNSKNRCDNCWEVRIKFLFEYAKKENIHYLTTTLLTSHYQEKDRILKIAKDTNKNYNLEFVELDSSLNETHSGFYKQNYCGCCFSLTEKMVGSINNLK